MTEALARAFLAALSEDTYGLMFELALSTGLRPEEYFALKWTDFEPERQTITVNRVLYRKRKGGGYSFLEPKTKKSRRTIPLPFSLAQRLSVHKSTSCRSPRQVVEHLLLRIENIEGSVRAQRRRNR